MHLKSIQKVIASALVAGGAGCIPLHRHPVKVPSTMSSTEPTTMMSPTTGPTTMMAPVVAPTTEPMTVTTPATQPVATQDLGSPVKVPGLAPKPKPFIAVPRAIRLSMARPSQLLLSHASPDSPVPLSEYANQPVYSVESFHLHKGLSAGAVQKKMGAPAQLADTEDPWLVYRLTGDREIWLHFSTGTDSEGMVNLVLDAADVVRGAEDGYVRDRVFSAD